MEKERVFFNGTTFEKLEGETDEEAITRLNGYLDRPESQYLRLEVDREEYRRGDK